MREAFFILLIVLVLLALTALRYRKQIVGLIRLGRMLKGGGLRVDAEGRQIRNEAAVSLINCSQCGVWVPQAKALKTGETYFCSDSCLKATVSR